MGAPHNGGGAGGRGEGRRWGSFLWVAGLVLVNCDTAAWE